jgi:hypothetical protein
MQLNVFENRNSQKCNIPTRRTFDRVVRELRHCRQKRTCRRSAAFAGNGDRLASCLNSVDQCRSGRSASDQSVQFVILDQFNMIIDFSLISIDFCCLHAFLGQIDVDFLHAGHRSQRLGDAALTIATRHVDD